MNNKITPLMDARMLAESSERGRLKAFVKLDALAAELEAAKTELAWLKVKQGTGTTSDNYRAELYDEVWHVARDMGYPNATMALTELAAIKAGAGKRIYQACDGVNGWEDVDLLRYSASQLLPEEYFTRIVYATPQPAPDVSALLDALKDHQTAALVNDLRDVAIKYHGTGQLRARLAAALAQYEQGGGK